MNEPVNEVPFLLAQNGPLQGQIWPINKEIIIGRDPLCDIVINDRQVSRKHAKVENQNNNGNSLADLNSKNGTLLNGEYVEGPTPLKDGDEIIIGLVQEFLFVSSDATLPLGQTPLEEQGAAQKLFIDKKARRIWIGEKELIPALSVSQYELLLFLYERPGCVVSREEIVNAVWGEQEAVGVTEQALDALVRRLRGRLNKIDPTHDYVLTVRGVGFKFENDAFG
jgi:DNA-binding winged helix-turn-helix (wHTH) protein